MSSMDVLRLLNRNTESTLETMFVERASWRTSLSGWKTKMSIFGRKMQRWRSRRTCSALRRWVPLCLLGFWWTKRLALWGCCWPKLLGSKRKRGANRWRYRWHFVSGTLGVCRWVAVPSRNWIPIRRTRLLRKYWIERKGEARSVRYYDNYISQTSEFIIHEENTKEYHNLDAYIT